MIFPARKTMAITIAIGRYSICKMKLLSLILNALSFENTRKGTKGNINRFKLGKAHISDPYRLSYW
jgi:hypothetical protein